MKTFVWVLVFGVVVYFIYRRAHDYGLPWKPHVIIENYEANKRSVSGAQEIYVTGEVANMTRKKVNARIECVARPGGPTISAKQWTDVTLHSRERVPFDITVRARTGATGADCKIGEWSIEDGLEDKAAAVVNGLYLRIKRFF